MTVKTRATHGNEPRGHDLSTAIGAARWLLIAPLPFLACCGGEGSNRQPITEWAADQIAIVVSSEAPDALRWAAEDAQGTIDAATGHAPDLVADAGATDAPFLLLVDQGSCPGGLGPEDYTVQDGEHEGRPSLAFCGGGLLGRQFAVYAYLEALGVRFVHPEQTFVPSLAALPAGLPPELGREVHSPPLEVRGFHEHTQHPLELLEALITDDQNEVERAYRYIDWLVRNRQNLAQWILLDSVPQDEMLTQAQRVIDYAHARGVRVSAVTSFNEEQQNAHVLIDTHDASDDIEDLRAGLDALMTASWDSIVLNIGSSEFSETDDVETVAWMDETARHLGQIAPETLAYTSNHVPAGLLSETYGVSFYDLPRFAVPEMGAYVHTTMCYGLEGPAPVYGNADFSRQRIFLVDQVDDRNIIYYPESAWWLTFDNAIPLFLPVYLRVRAADLGFVGGVDGVQGHVTFSSGREWGYWLTDLAIAHHSWEPSLTLREVLDELLAPIDSRAADIIDRMAESQWSWLVEERLMPFLTAEDLPTEIGYRAGVVFHDLAPGPSEVMAFDPEALDDLSEQLESLEAFCEELDGFAGELAALPDDGDVASFQVMRPTETAGSARQPATIDAEPLLDELRDGAEVTAARCWNALYNYRGLVAARTLALELPTGDDPAALLAQAAEQTARAAEIVGRRETAYRYEPGRTSDHEDTGGAGASNVTDYPYRVYGRTHVLYFWHRRDLLTAEAVGGEGRQLVIGPQQLLVGETITVDATEAGLDEGADVSVTWGDGGEDAAPAGVAALFEHTYAAPSQPVLRVTATAEGEAVSLELPVSAATALFTLPAESFDLIEPADATAEMVLRPFFPTLQLGFNGGSAEAPEASLGFDRDQDGVVEHGTVVFLPPGERTGDHFTFSGFGLTVPVESASGRLGTIYLQQAVLEFDLAGTATDEDTLSSGTLRTSVRLEELVALIVSTGVLEREGVISILASIFGFEPIDPPDLVQVTLALEGTLLRRIE
jgi:hypothetical protein